MDDQIINLGDYRQKKQESSRTLFAVWGGEGENSRFALPLWRAIYLVGGDRAGLMWAPEGTRMPDRLRPFFVLDLAEEPPRTEFEPDWLSEALWEEREAPRLEERSGEGLAVFLGLQDARRWYLIVEGRSDSADLEGATRDDILFLSGECAGLLFHREFSNSAE